MAIEGLRYHIGFSMIKNLNLRLAETLLTRIGSEEAFFTMESHALKSLSQLPEALCTDKYRQELLERARKEENFILSNDIETLYFNGRYYPSRLKNCEDGPVMLYLLGSVNLEAKHIISIVGTRHATPYGIDITSRIISGLAERLNDLVVVSGLAYGIDVAAHKAALDNDIPTIAVNAHPLNTVYPADHRGVAVQMVRKGGGMLSEYNTTDMVHKGNFLARNRIIAGISDVTIIVESDSKGGSLVTARLAQEYNRDVFAVPGRITDKYSRGTLCLIANNKAQIFTDVDEFIEELGWQTHVERIERELPLEIDLSPEQQSIYDFLTAHPASRVFDIVNGTGLPIGSLKNLLFEMEMNDLVISMAGGLYSAL